MNLLISVETFDTFTLTAILSFPFKTRWLLPGPKNSIIRLSPWGLLDLLFGSYGLRLRKMHRECDWQSVPFETTRRQSQSPAGAASTSPRRWKLQHKAMGDKKPICPLDNLPADVSTSVLVIYHASRLRFSSHGFTAFWGELVLASLPALKIQREFQLEYLRNPFLPCWVRDATYSGLQV